MLLLSLSIPLASLRERLRLINLGLLSPLDSILLSPDRHRNEVMLSLPFYSVNLVLTKPLACKVFLWSQFRHNSLPILNDLTGPPKELLNNSLVIAWMLGLTGVLVVSGDVVEGMSSTKVEVRALSHASKVASDGLVNKLEPDPGAMLFRFPVFEHTSNYRPLVA